MLGLEILLVDALEQLPGQHFDGRQHIHLIGTHQGDRLPGIAGTAGTADAVHIVFGDDRQVEVDHQWQVVDVQTTGRHIGGQQYLHFAGLEAVQRTLTGGLGLVAVDAVGVDALLLQQLGQLIDTLAGFHEHQGLGPFLFFQQVAKQLGLALLVDRDQPLLDAAGRDIARADFDAQRVIEHLPGQQADGLGEGGGEQQGLALLRQGRIDRAQLVGKAQVEHAVGFVQHQGLQLVELHRVLAEQVEQATGGGHQHVDALAQLHHLRVDAHPAVHRVGAQRQVLAVGAKALMHLLGQLAGRHQHQGAHRIAGHFRAFHHQTLQQRQGKTGGLAGAGLRRGHQVTAGQHRRDRLSLHRRRDLVVEFVEGALQGFDQAEGGESHGGNQSSGKRICQAAQFNPPARCQPASVRPIAAAPDWRLAQRLFRR